MTILLPETDWLREMKEPIQEHLNLATTVQKCCNCGFPMRIPLMVKESDIHEINTFISVLSNYLQKHPEIQQKMIAELKEMIKISIGRN